MSSRIQFAMAPLLMLTKTPQKSSVDHAQPSTDGWTENGREYSKTLGLLGPEGMPIRR